MAEARTAHRERHRQQHAVVALARELAEPSGDMDVRGVKHAGFVEHPQQTVRRTDDAGVELVDLVVVVGVDRNFDDAHAGTSPVSNRALIASTRLSGGRHANTPHGRPSTTGVSGPIIPRMKRYNTPARWRWGV